MGCMLRLSDWGVFASEVFGVSRIGFIGENLVYCLQ